MKDYPLLRTSERGQWKRCPQKWWWGSVEELVPKRMTRPALVFGTIFHEAMARYYKPGLKRGPHPAKTFEKLYMEHIAEHGKVKIRDMDDEDERRDLGELGIAVCRAYIDHYGEDEDIDIIQPEFPFKVLLRDSAGNKFYYVGRMDALFRWRLTGEKGLLEHKTGSEDLKSHVQLDEQTGSYWTFAPTFLRKMGLMKPKEKLDIILFNFARKTKGDDRPTNAEGYKLNKNGTVSKRQPPKQFERIPVYRDQGDMQTIRQRIKDEQMIMQMMRDGELPIYKNPTNNCSWDCIFKEMCELHETGAHFEDYKEQMFNVGDSYAGYREDLFNGGR
jgi:hypothetical protein